jgi:hypothetical protein
MGISLRPNRGVYRRRAQVTELTRLGWHLRETEDECTTQNCHKKRRGRPPNPCIRSNISLRLGPDLEFTPGDFQ